MPVPPATGIPNPMLPGGDPNKPPPPPLDLEDGKKKIVGEWEATIVDPRTRKINRLVNRFRADGSYTFGKEVDGKMQQNTGKWAMAVQGQAYIVSIELDPMPTKDGKPGKKTQPTLALVKFDGEDTLVVGGAQSFSRKK
jgi:hypothetical protein